MKAMTTTELKKAIKAKFGSVGRLADLSGFPYWSMINVLNERINPDKVPGLLSIIQEKFEQTKPDADKFIKDEEREFVRIMLVSKFKSLKNFCEKNPKFSMTFVSNVINGRRKKRDQRFKNLLKRCN